MAMADPLDKIRQRLDRFLTTGKRPNFKLSDLSAGIESYEMRFMARWEKQVFCEREHHLISEIRSDIAAKRVEIKRKLAARKAKGKERRELGNKKLTLQNKLVEEDVRAKKKKIEAKLTTLRQQRTELKRKREELKGLVVGLKSLKVAKQMELRIHEENLKVGNEFCTQMVEESNMLLETINSIASFVRIPASYEMKVVRRADVMGIAKLKELTGLNISGYIGSSTSQVTARLIMEAAELKKVKIQPAPFPARDAALDAVAQAAAHHPRG